MVSPSFGHKKKPRLGAYSRINYVKSYSALETEINKKINLTVAFNMKMTFIDAIASCNKVRLTFHSKEDEANLTRICAPMDYGPSRRAKDKSDRFHLWDYESDRKNHVLSLLPEQVISIERLDDVFSPDEFVTWDTTTSHWFISRDWGKHS